MESNHIFFSFAHRRTAEVLMQESGCCLENPAATKFRQHVMAGDWIKADHYLQELMPMIEAKQPSIVVSAVVFFAENWKV